MDTYYVESRSQRSPSVNSPFSESSLSSSIRSSRSPMTKKISNWVSNSNNWIIIVLSVLLFLSIININILQILVDILFRVIVIFRNLIVRLLIFLGIIAGNTLELTGELIGETGDIAENTLGIAGRAINGVATNTHIGSGGNFRPYVTSLSSGKSAVRPSMGSIDNMKPNTADKKTAWCLLGDVKGGKGCVELNKTDTCLSGLFFDSYEKCLNVSFA